MKQNSIVVVAVFIAAINCCRLVAQEKPPLQPTATVGGILQSSTGKAVEVHLSSGEKMGGKVAQVTDNMLHLSNLTGAEYFDAFIAVKDISAVVIRTGGR